MDGAELQDLLRTLLPDEVLLEPAAFFRTMIREGGIGAPLVYAIIGVVIGSLGSLITRVVSPFGMLGGGFIRRAAVSVAVA